MMLKAAAMLISPMLRTALIGLCVVALTGPANADYFLHGQLRSPCRMLPPVEMRHAPSVAFRIVTLPQASVQKVCAAGRKVAQPITACASGPGIDGTPIWKITISDFLVEPDKTCVLVYEKAHLPPNNWVDQAWEDQALTGHAYITRRSETLSH